MAASDTGPLPIRPPLVDPTPLPGPSQSIPESSADIPSQQSFNVLQSNHSSSKPIQEPPISDVPVATLFDQTTTMPTSDGNIFSYHLRVRTFTFLFGPKGLLQRVRCTIEKLNAEFQCLAALHHEVTMI